MKTPSTEMLEEVLTALGPLTDELVFVGGAILRLYFQDPSAEGPRQTDDVDCVTAVATTPEFYRFEERLRAAGFEPCQESKAPICRWWVAGHRVDFMPQAGEALGFGNRWYRAGRESCEKVRMPSGQALKIFSLPYFLASKLEAHGDRGGKDLRLSQDLEDVLVVLGSRQDLKGAARRMDPPVRSALAQAFRRIKDQADFDEAITAAIENLGPQPMRRGRILSYIDELLSDKEDA